MWPGVIEQTANGRESYDLPSRLLKDRIVLVQGESRLEHPDASLAELGDYLEISKSGANHRMRKLKELEQMIKDEIPFDLAKL
ncbi:hypothetical protein GQS40_02880|uniref:Sporulation regulator WhiA C-terminal domain-containing protein n=1 Tax=Leuconostoc lactis TaxID=1246 RepID=A0A6L7AB20_LEULA|nr:hypothetical protein [Leuconostoc lactis]